MEKVDLILKNADVLTLDKNNHRAGSVAVRDGRIVGVWETSEPPKDEVHVTEETNIVDLKGETLIPGFIDTHNHISAYARIQSFLDCSCSMPSIQKITDILNLVKVKCQQTPVGKWVTGFGYDDTALEDGRHITKQELDHVSPHHPVYISHISGHSAIANSKAFQLAGIEEDIQDSQNGYYGRDKDGHLNGAVFENGAMSHFTKVIPEPTKEELLEEMKLAVRDFLAQGITMNTDSAVGMSNDPKKEIDIHVEAARSGLNPIHSRLMIVHSLLEQGELYENYTAKELDQELREYSNGMVRLDSAKLFQDGSIQGLTAALRDPYYCDETKGQLFQEQAAFNHTLSSLHKRGYRMAIHGNGDAAIGSIIEGYAHALQEAPREDHRHRIEHVQTGTKEDIAAMKRLGIAGSFFINHVYYWGERHREMFLGPERASRISPLADAVQEDLLFTLHSDCPITPISPLFSIWAAVNRVTDDGNVLGPEQRIDVISALKSMTIYGAALNFDEANSGSIEIGKRADFAVLDQNPTLVHPMEIKDISVQATIINGMTVYQKEKMSIG